MSKRNIATALVLALLTIGCAHKTAPVAIAIVDAPHTAVVGTVVGQDSLRGQFPDR